MSNAAERARAAAARHKRDFDPRQAMPQCAAWIDDLRAAFGDPVGIRAEEGGKTIRWGRLPTLGPGVCRCRTGCRRPKPENAFKRPQPKIDI